MLKPPAGVRYRLQNVSNAANLPTPVSTNDVLTYAKLAADGCDEVPWGNRR